MHRGLFLLGFEGISSLDELLPWIGSSVEVEIDQLPATAPGEFYQFEAIGLEVRTVGGEVIGVVHEVLTMPANDLWVVRPTAPDGAPAGAPREHLIPVVAPIVLEVDLARRVAVIDPPPGLLDG
jgi:16S rRNA processing protein RimM